MTEEERKKTIATIWAKAAELGLYDKKSSEEEKKSSELYIIINTYTGKNGMRNCTDEELFRILDYLKLFKKHDKVVKSNDMITSKQKWKINHLVKELGWQDNPKRLEGFIFKETGIKKIQWLSKTNATKVITGLERYLKGSENKNESK